MNSLRKKCVFGVWMTYLVFISIYLFTLYTTLFSFGYPKTPYYNMQYGQRFTTNAIFMTIVNVPDLFCAIVYGKLWKHLRKTSVQPTPQQNIDTAPNVQNPTSTSEKANSVMKTLRLHILTCFSDFVLVGAAFISNFGYRRFLIYHMFIFQAYWVPLIVVRSSFQHMRNLCQKFFSYF